MKKIADIHEGLWFGKQPGDHHSNLQLQIEDRMIWLGRWNDLDPIEFLQHVAENAFSMECDIVDDCFGEIMQAALDLVKENE